MRCKGRGTGAQQRAARQVMDYAEGGDLHGLIKEQNAKLLPEERVLDYFVQARTADSIDPMRPPPARWSPIRSVAKMVGRFSRLASRRPPARH